MKGGGRTDGPARVRHWWNGKVIQSRVDSGVRSTKVPVKEGFLSSARLPYRRTSRLHQGGPRATRDYAEHF